jgi:transcriptional regulator GlxA family with amidase domain
MSRRVLSHYDRERPTECTSESVIRLMLQLIRTKQGTTFQNKCQRRLASGLSRSTPGVRHWELPFLRIQPSSSRTCFSVIVSIVPRLG